MEHHKIYILKSNPEKLLTALMAMQFTIESLDNLEGTKIYKHKILSRSNTLKKDLINSLGHEFDAIYIDDQKNFDIFIRGMEDIAKWFATAPFNDILDLASAMRKGELKFKPNEQEE